MFLSIPDPVMNSHIYWIDVLMRLQVSVEVSLWLKICFRRFKRPLEYSDTLLSSQWSFSSAYNSKWSRCFWASQILWCGWRLLCDWKSLLRSEFDWIEILDVLNFLLNIQIDCWVVNQPFLQLYVHVKYMFLSIPDSVMNSHI